MSQEAQARWIVARGWARAEQVAAAASLFDPKRDEDLAAALIGLGLLTRAQAAELRAALQPLRSETGSTTRPLAQRAPAMVGPTGLAHSASWADSQSGESGPTVVGGYELGEELSRGAVGVVHQARRLSDGHAVALKLLQRDDDEEELARFAREAEALIKVNHPNIVRILDLGSHQGRPYLSR